MYELFHSTNDGGASARVRSLVVAHGLESKLRFRNVFYPEVSADLRARGGRKTPALWDGEKLFEGEEAVCAAIDLLAKR